MNRIELTLIQLEKCLQRLIEGSLSALFPNQMTQPDLVQHLMNAMHLDLRQSSNGDLVAPDMFTIFLPKDQAELWQENPEVEAALTRSLQSAGEEALLRFNRPPSVRILEQPEPGLQEIQVTAQFSLTGKTGTATLKMPAYFVEPTLSKNNQAFFIFSGASLYQIQDSIVNIGRHPDNQFVIEDERVSRFHAQLRLVKERYMLFDLDSTGGTYVNHKRIIQTVLEAGDVISLAGFSLVFGLETNSQDKPTQKLSPEMS